MAFRKTAVVAAGTNANADEVVGLTETTYHDDWDHEGGRTGYGAHGMKTTRRRKRMPCS